METLEEFIKEIETSRELQREFKSLKGQDATDAFLKKHDCDATAHELAEFIRSQLKAGEGELSDDEAFMVAGGIWLFWGDCRWWEDDEPFFCQNHCGR